MRMARLMSRREQARALWGAAAAGEGSGGTGSGQALRRSLMSCRVYTGAAAGARHTCAVLLLTETAATARGRSWPDSMGGMGWRSGGGGSAALLATTAAAGPAPARWKGDRVRLRRCGTKERRDERMERQRDGDGRRETCEPGRACACRKHMYKSNVQSAHASSRRSWTAGGEGSRVKDVREQQGKAAGVGGQACYSHASSAEGRAPESSPPPQSAQAQRYCRRHHCRGQAGRG